MGEAGRFRERGAKTIESMNQFAILRNEYRGHGLTPSDSRAESIARELIDVWKRIKLGMVYLEHCSFFRLEEVRRRRTSIDARITPLVGSSEELVSTVIACEESSPLVNSNADEIYIEFLNSESILPAWPLLMCDSSLSRTGEVWILDGIKDESISYRRFGRESDANASKRLVRLGADSKIVKMLRSFVGK